MKPENISSVKVSIRKATRLDVPQIFKLIQELAEFEKAPHEVTNSPDQLLRDGFGDNPLYGCFVAEVNGLVVGMALYYFRYSTWKGKRMYLEDIVITESYRRHKIGRHLFEAVMAECAKTECSGMVWQVLDWNEPAIKFYEKYEPVFDNEWVNVSLSQKQIEFFFGDKNRQNGF